jgi:D-beta-D-heptose 7-phosphate kinase / D-beta-D-heptose 1-phosphate adenosyltransferase
MQIAGPTWRRTGNPHELEALGRELMRQMEAPCMVLTLDKDGAMLLDETGTMVTIPTQAREVYDVSGAGDMFLAGLAAARVNGCSWVDSVRFANAAAGLEVEVFGVQPIPFEDVRLSLLRLAGKAQAGKLRTLPQALAEIADLRRRGKSIVFTNGCFDVLHSGHVTLLERAASFGDVLLVGVNSDASVRTLKGPSRPINTFSDRARVLGALGCVGMVIEFDRDRTGDCTPLDLIEALCPDVLVKGADYEGRQVVGADFVRGRGGRVELIPLVHGQSSSSTIMRIGL